MRKVFQEGLNQYAAIKWKTYGCFAFAAIAIPLSILQLLLKKQVEKYFYYTAKRIHSVSTGVFVLGIAAGLTAFYYYRQLDDRENTFEKALMFRDRPIASAEKLDTLKAKTQQNQSLDELNTLFAHGFDPTKFSHVFKGSNVTGSALCCAIKEENTRAAIFILLFYPTEKERRQAAMEAMAFVKNDVDFQFLYDYAAGSDEKAATAALENAIRSNHTFAIKKIIDLFPTDKKKALESSLNLTVQGRHIKDINIMNEVGEKQDSELFLALTEKGRDVKAILESFGVVVEQEHKTVDKLLKQCEDAGIGDASNPLSDELIKNIVKVLSI